METNKNENPILNTLILAALALFAPGLALAQSQDANQNNAPKMDPFCGAHFADTHTHGRRCAVCEQELQFDCSPVDGKIDACLCTRFLDPSREIVWNKLINEDQVVFTECVRFGYLNLPAEIPAAQQNPINKDALLARIENAIKARTQLLSSGQELDLPVNLIRGEIERLNALKQAVEENIDTVHLARILILRELQTPPKSPTPVKKVVKGPGVTEGVVTVASSTVIGAGVGAGVGWAASASVLTASTVGGPVGLGLGLVAVGIWWLVAD